MPIPPVKPEPFKTQERIIFEPEYIIVLSPYPVSSPYEGLIAPKRHSSCYLDIDDSEVLDTAFSIKKTLGAYITRLYNPDFNYFIHNAPFPLAGIPYYHMYIQIVPRIQTIGGFEIGTMIPVNSEPPETVAKLLA